MNDTPAPDSSKLAPDFEPTPEGDSNDGTASNGGTH